LSFVLDTKVSLLIMIREISSNPIFIFIWLLTCPTRMLHILLIKPQTYFFNLNNINFFPKKKNSYSFKLIENIIQYVKNVKDKSTNKRTTFKLIIYNAKIPTNNIIKLKWSEYTCLLYEITKNKKLDSYKDHLFGFLIERKRWRLMVSGQSWHKTTPHWKNRRGNLERENYDRLIGEGGVKENNIDLLLLVFRLYIISFTH